MNNIYKYVVVFLCITVLGGIYFLKNNEKNNVVEKFDDFSEISEREELQNRIYVFVCGSVNDPRVIECQEGIRVFEAIELCGGTTDDADVSRLNMAAVLKDGDKLYVPDLNGNTDTFEGLININYASKEELMTLSGIGESRAEEIIKYRENVNTFYSIEDIMLVNGIKVSAFEKIKDFICV